ncbi:MAG: hypothetical protein QM493_01795 [Sulfurovum sp.]
MTSENLLYGVSLTGIVAILVFWAKSRLQYSIKHENDKKFENLKNQYETNKNTKAVIKGLLSKMSSVKNSVNSLLKDIEHKQSINENLFKKVEQSIKEANDYFNNNRGNLYDFIDKESSPIFVDNIVILENAVHGLKTLIDIKHRKTLQDSYDNFHSLYNKYYAKYEKILSLAT